VADESIQPNDELGAKSCRAPKPPPVDEVAIIGISLVVMVVAIASDFGFLIFVSRRQYRHSRGTVSTFAKNTATSRSQSRST